MEEGRKKRIERGRKEGNVKEGQKEKAMEKRTKEKRKQALQLPGGVRVKESGAYALTLVHMPLDLY